MAPLLHTLQYDFLLQTLEESGFKPRVIYEEASADEHRPRRPVAIVWNPDAIRTRNDATSDQDIENLQEIYEVTP